MALVVLRLLEQSAHDKDQARKIIERRYMKGIYTSKERKAMLECLETL